MKAPDLDAAHRGEDVDTALWQAQELIRRAMASQRSRADQLRQLAGDDEASHSVCDRLAEAARQEIVCVLAASDVSQGRHDHLTRLLVAAQRRGVRVKVLVASPDHAMAMAFLRSWPEQVSARAATMAEHNLIVADGREAAVRVPNRSGSVTTLTITARPLVRILRDMFGICWVSGSSPVEALVISERLRNPLSLSIIASLRDGDIDATAARNLGLSVRTYRRYVADIMRSLNASSRFQAGVRAAELGLLEVDQRRR